MLNLGLSNLYPSLSLSSKTTILRSKFSGQTPAKGVHTIRMAASNKTVPNIGVYVIVPNKDAVFDRQIHDVLSTVFNECIKVCISLLLIQQLAESIVKEKLAACVNRVPGIESVYQWKGEIQTDSEELLLIETRESLLEALKDNVKANHKYDVPEVIASPIVGGSIPYLEWLKENTRG